MSCCSRVRCHRLCIPTYHQCPVVHMFDVTLSLYSHLPSVSCCSRVRCHRLCIPTNHQCPVVHVLDVTVFVFPLTISVLLFTCLMSPCLCIPISVLSSTCWLSMFIRKLTVIDYNMVDPDVSNQYVVVV